MPKIAYKQKRINSGAMQIIHHTNRLIDAFAEEGVDEPTLRQLYYQFIAQDLFPESWIDEEYNQKHGLALDTKNTMKNYKKLGDITRQQKEFPLGYAR